MKNRERKGEEILDELDVMYGYGLEEEEENKVAEFIDKLIQIIKERKEAQAKKLKSMTWDYVKDFEIWVII